MLIVLLEVFPRFMYCMCPRVRRCGIDAPARVSRKGVIGVAKMLRSCALYSFSASPGVVQSVTDHAQPTALLLGSSRLFLPTSVIYKTLALSGCGGHDRGVLQVRRSGRHRDPARGRGQRRSWVRFRQVPHPRRRTEGGVLSVFAAAVKTMSY